MPKRSAVPVLFCSSAVQANVEHSLFCCLFDWEEVTRLVKSIVSLMESSFLIHHFEVSPKCES